MGAVELFVPLRGRLLEPAASCDQEISTVKSALCICLRYSIVVL